MSPAAPAPAPAGRCGSGGGLVLVARVEARLADERDPVDLLVNNAGYGLGERFLVNDVEDAQGMLDVLVVAVLRLSHAALRAMTAHDSAPGFLWLDVDRLVAEALADLDRGRVVSVPSRRYRAVVALSRAVPNGVLHRLQGLGRG